MGKLYYLPGIKTPKPSIPQEPEESFPRYQLPIINTRTIYNDPVLDRLDRVRATRSGAKEMWPMLLIPVLGWAIYVFTLLELRYGRRM